MTHKVDLFLEQEGILLFKAIFSFGIIFHVTVGNNLFDVLCRQIGIAESYLDQRVQTIFLNNKVVDNIFAETVTDGSVIALSAAMPGLFGALVRKDGVLASMRTPYNPSISIEKSKHNGHTTLKLFNLVASELGADMLKSGVYMKGENFLKYLQWKADQLKLVCQSLTVDGNQTVIDDVLNSNWQGSEVYLRLKSLGC